MNRASSSFSSAVRTRRSSRTSAPAAHPINIVGCATHRAPPLAAKRRVRAGPEAKPVTFLPVLKIVTRAARAWPGDVGNFILFEPAALEPRQPLEIHLRRIVVRCGRQAGPRHLVAERRIGVNLQQIQRCVIGLQRDQRLHRLQPVRLRLPREPHHQVEAQVVESRRARERHRLPRGLGRMETAQTLELLVPKGLDTETESIDAGLTKAVKGFSRGRFRVGFERDFGVGAPVQNCRGTPG